MHAYDTAAFLLQYEHHCAVRGRPKFVHSDPGSQIKRATFYLADSTNNSQLDITKIVDMDARKGTTWKICPTASQWQNGLAELGVKAFKETITLATDGRMLNYAELIMTLHRIATIINDRPLGVRDLDNEVIQPVTPNMLIIGKTTTAPDFGNHYEMSKDKFTEQLALVEDVENEW